MINLRPKYSSISGIIVCSDGFIVLESYGPKVNDKCYLYKISLSGNLIWEVQHPTHKYAQFCNLEIRNNKLIVHDGSGEANLNPDTGELTKWVLTK